MKTQKRNYKIELRKLNKQKDDLKLWAIDEVRKTRSYNAVWIEIGSWDCGKSPVGVCAYDEEKDRAYDNCLFCHMPDERK